MVLAHVRGEAGQKIALKLDGARAWDDTNGNEMMITSQNGEFTVLAAPWQIHGGRNGTRRIRGPWLS